VYKYYETKKNVNQKGKQYVIVARTWRTQTGYLYIEQLLSPVFILNCYNYKNITKFAVMIEFRHVIIEFTYTLLISYCICIYDDDGKWTITIYQYKI